jgi:alpha-tubulin suppressor-like RCC1 family protein
MSNGNLAVWGSNLFGQLGTNFRPVPYGKERDNFTAEPLNLSIPGHKVKKVSAGIGHSAVITEDDALWTWGLGTDG